MGMSIQDFERCTPPQFKAAADAWSRQQERAEQTSWEQTRMLAMISNQVWSKKKLKPSDVMVFPWDMKTGVKRGTSSKERMEEVMRRLKK